MSKKAEVECFDGRGHRLFRGDCVRVSNKDGQHVTTGVFQRANARGWAVVSVTGIGCVCDPNYLTRVNADNASTPTTWFHAGKPADTTEFERLFSGGAP